MKKLACCLSCFLILGLNSVQGQEQVNQKNEDLESMINYIGKEKGFSEAEIEQTMGVAFLKQDNQGERAEKHFKNAVRLDPKLYKSWYSLGLLHIDSEKGMGYFRKAIKEKSDYSSAYYWIAYYYTRYGNFKKALPIWKDYLRVAVRDTEEEGRIRVAKKVIEQIESGKPGEELRAIHLH